MMRAALLLIVAVLHRAAAEEDGLVVGCTDLAADNFDALAQVADESACRYGGLPNVPLAGEDANLGFHATKAHCEQRGGRLVGSNTLRVLGSEVAEEQLPLMWPVYEPLERVAGMPPIYKCIGGAWAYGDEGLDGVEL